MKKNRKQFPEKCTINVVTKKCSQWSPVRVLPLLLVLALFVLAFGKFAVADRLAAVERQWRTLLEMADRKAALIETLADYNESSAQYRRYSASWMNSEEQAAVDRIEILNLMEQELMSAATVGSFSITGNVLSIKLSGITLEGTSVIIKRLKTYPIVSSVAVYTATTKTQSDKEAEVAMHITLAQDTEWGTR